MPPLNPRAGCWCDEQMTMPVEDTHRCGTLLCHWFAPLLVLMAVATTALAQSTSEPPVKPLSFGDTIGLGVKFSQGQPLEDLPMLLDLRVKWVRENIWWNDIEPEPGKFAPLPGYLKRQLAFYKKHDIGFVALLGIGNGRAYPRTADDPGRPFDPDAFARFAEYMARTLKAEGVRFVLELGNEPHNSSMPKALGGAWNGKAPSPWVDHYAKMVRTAVARVRAYDPSIRMLSDDDMWVLHYWFLEAGLPAELDGFAVHPYTPGIPERTAVAHDTDWTRPFTVVDVDRSFGSAVRRLRERGQAKFGRQPSIWVTEWGWPIGDGSKGSVSEDLLAAYLPRAFILSAAAGVEVLCWFSSRDSVDGPMGLTRNDRTQRKSYQAFKTLTAQLSDSVLVRQVAGKQRPTTGTQAFLFEGSRGRTVAVWNTEENGQQLKLPTGGAFTATDALGEAVHAETAATESTASFAIGTRPVYIQGPWTDSLIESSFPTAR